MKNYKMGSKFLEDYLAIGKRLGVNKNQLLAETSICSNSITYISKKNADGEILKLDIEPLVDFGGFNLEDYIIKGKIPDPKKILGSKEKLSLAFPVIFTQPYMIMEIINNEFKGMNYKDKRYRDCFGDLQNLEIITQKMIEMWKDCLKPKSIKEQPVHL